MTGFVVFSAAGAAFEPPAEAVAGVLEGAAGPFFASGAGAFGAAVGAAFCAEPAALASGRQTAAAEAAAAPRRTTLASR